MSDKSDLRLLELQVEALFTHDARGRIRAINEPRGDRAPRFFLGRTREGALWRCRDDVPEESVRALARLAAEEPVSGDLWWEQEPRNRRGYLAVLGADGAAVDGGPAYRFPTVLPPAEATRIVPTTLHLLGEMTWNLEQTAREFARYEPFLAVVEDGRVVSLCHSSRLTPRAAEAGLETLDAYRRRGHASTVVLAWAHALRASGRTPLYSTAWDNLASQGLARRLGLLPYATDWSVA